MYLRSGTKKLIEDVVGEFNFREAHFPILLTGTSLFVRETTLLTCSYRLAMKA